MRTAAPDRRPLDVDRWVRRFGDDVPFFARELAASVATALDDDSRVGDLREGAQALGVLRAQQGHAVAGLVEDLLALREALAEAGERRHRVVDVALTLATAAYVDELTAMLARRATRDPLTGLPNRAAFDDVLSREVAATGRGAAPALLLLDLDRFKLVNDRDGHLAGDAVLQAVAELLRTHVRPGDLACRLGGDEFAVVLPRTSAARAKQATKRLLAAARTDPGLSSASSRVTLSCGIGWLRQPASDVALVALADRALYAAKAAGGDDVRVSAPAPEVGGA